MQRAGIFILAVLIIGLAVPAAEAQDLQVIVSGQANIFGSGHCPGAACTPNPGGGGGGEPPVQIQLTSGTSRILTLAAAGMVKCADVPGNGPDGGTQATGGTNICSHNGVSGITYGPESGLQGSGKTMFLVGVFLGDSEPQDPAPARLDFSATSLTDPDHNRFGEDFLELRPLPGADLLHR
jgi:hypothetical protein